MPKSNEQEKKKVGVYLPVDLIERMNNAVVWLAAPPEQLTLSRFAENAVRRELDRLEKKYNKGKPFKATTAQIRKGRPRAM